MNRVSSLAVAALCLAAACGGKQTIASKSASAYRDAIARGVPVGAGGHVHGGHEHVETAGADAGTGGVEHPTMPGLANMSMPQGHSGEPMSAADHTKTPHGGSAGMHDMSGMQMNGTSESRSGTQPMTGMGHSAMAGMDHSKMQHGKRTPMHDMSGMQMGAANEPASGSQSTTGMNRGAMAGMDHSKMQHGAAAGAQPMTMSESSMQSMEGMHHGAAPTSVHAAPSTSSAISRLSPASTLQPDAFDAPSPASVRESTKTKGNEP